MKVKPSKVLFCKFIGHNVKEYAPWTPKEYEEAVDAIRTLNDSIAGPDGELGDEFWFLNATIHKETHIITLTTKINYPSNDPAFLDKLSSYIDDNSIVFPTGTKYNRNKFKQPGKKDVPVNTLTIISHKRSNQKSATELCNKLNERLGNKGSSNYAVEGGQHIVYIQSNVYDRDKLYAILNEVK